MYKLCSIKQMSVSADSPSCLCGLGKKQFYRRLKTTPLLWLFITYRKSGQTIPVKCSGGYLYLTSMLKHNLTFQCILCDFKSATIFLNCLEKLLFSFEAIKILQVQGLWLEDICSFKGQKKKFEASLAKHKAM